MTDESFETKKETSNRETDNNACGLRGALNDRSFLPRKIMVPAKTF